MFASPRKTKYPTDAQLEIWTLNRNNIQGKEIAKLKNVTSAFVSKTLKLTTKRIEGLLVNAAKTNRITLDIIDPVLGFAKGYHHTLKDIAHLTFSPRNGVQVWYEHQGDCTDCEIFDECRNMLLNEFEERNLKPKSETLAPTNLADELFLNLEALSQKKKGSPNDTQ
ncbi:MAG: hypothetical protein ACXABI_06500 [Candidatus Hodarchaeales archaeon]|jgi:hypothetical protein